MAREVGFAPEPSELNCVKVSPVAELTERSRPCPHYIKLCGDCLRGAVNSSLLATLFTWSETKNAHFRDAHDVEQSVLGSKSRFWNM